MERTGNHPAAAFMSSAIPTRGITLCPVTREGSGNQSPEEFDHLFRPDFPQTDNPEAPDAPGGSETAQRRNEFADADPFSDWEPLVAVPQATPQGGISAVDPPLPEPVSTQVAQGQAPALEEPDAIDAVDAPLPPADPKEGRLFRSRGGPERQDAVTAIGSMQARRLRTLARSDEPFPAAVAAEFVQEVEPEAAMPPILPVASSGEPAPALQVMASTGQQRQLDGQQASARETGRGRSREPRQRAERPSSGSLTGLGVYAVTIGVTVILAFGETLIFGGEPGIITGIGLLVVSVFAAFTVRTHDGINAIFAPAIAFFVAAITAGQVGVNAAGLTSRAVVVFFLLGSNWMWILGSTAVALVIVALRRRVG